MRKNNLPRLEYSFPDSSDLNTAGGSVNGATWPSIHRWIGLTPDPESDDDTGEPDELQQGELPTGPTHVATRGTPRTKDQLASASKFLAAAGRVKFDRGRATLKAVWMSVAY